MLVKEFAHIGEYETGRFLECAVRVNSFGYAFALRLARSGVTTLGFVVAAHTR